MNFTEADLNVQNLPNPNITGDFQATEAWPFKELSDDALTRDIDLIIHVGDYRRLQRAGTELFRNERHTVRDGKELAARRHYELCARSIW